MQKSVLIVHNADPFWSPVAQMLRDAGYDLIEAVGSKDALSKLDGRKIHLIICDADLPGMDGVTFVGTVKRFIVYAFTPVIMLTRGLDEARKSEGQASGVTTWMTKPVQHELFLNTIFQMVGA